MKMGHVLSLRSSYTVLFMFVDVMMNKFRTVSPSRQTVVTVKYTDIYTDISTSTISVDILIVHMQLGTIPLYDSKL